MPKCSRKLFKRDCFILLLTLDMTQPPDRRGPLRLKRLLRVLNERNTVFARSGPLYATGVSLGRLESSNFPLTKTVAVNTAACGEIRCSISVYYCCAVYASAQRSQTQTINSSTAMYILSHVLLTYLLTYLLKWNLKPVGVISDVFPVPRTGNGCKSAVTLVYVYNGDSGGQYVVSLLYCDQWL